MGRWGGPHGHPSFPFMGPPSGGPSVALHTSPVTAAAKTAAAFVMMSWRCHPFARYKAAATTVIAEWPLLYRNIPAYRCQGKVRPLPHRSANLCDVPLPLHDSFGQKLEGCDRPWGGPHGPPPFLLWGLLVEALSSGSGGPPYLAGDCDSSLASTLAMMSWRCHPFTGFSNNILPN
ncbi:hypothetical protein Syun_002064 [Stephania yunnanensis]|uniref:Uncharacterized protein n=1 Tax=Stephania yunnanensis TaxID=152371 RepID=A0AAP0LKS6_9MAGN